MLRQSGVIPRGAFDGGSGRAVPPDGELQRNLFEQRAARGVPARPALPLAIFLILGISLYRVAPTCIGLWIGAAGGCCLAAIVCRRRAVVCSIAIALAVLLGGLAAAQLQYDRVAHDQIGNCASDQPALAIMRLAIDNPPLLFYPPALNGRSAPPRQSVVATVLSVRGDAGWIDASGMVLVRLSQPDPWLRLGQRVQAIGMLQHLTPSSNPGQTDWADNERQHGIFASLQIGRAQNITVLDQGPIGVAGWLRQEARHLLSSGFTARRMTDYALLRALVLGDSDPNSRDVQDAFAQVGIAYQLAISGMHIALLAACAYFACRLFSFSPRSAVFICAGVVILYGIIALPTISARRAVFVCIAFLAAPLLSRSGDRMQLLALAAIGLLLLDPMDLASAGFQLGFVTLCGLSLFAPRLLHGLNEQRSRILSMHGIGRFPRLGLLSLRAWLTISAIGWIVSLPVVASQFGQISPLALPAGVIMFPLVVVALLGGWLKMIVTLLFPSAAVLAAHMIAVPCFVMRVLALRMAHLPGATLAASPPAAWMIFSYYALLALTLAPFASLRLTRIARGAAAVGICAFFLAITGISPLRPPAEGSADVATLDNEVTVCLLSVGAGQTAVVTVPGDGVSLIDCGSDSIADVARSVLLPYLNLHRDRSIARVFLSHTDYDHISALSSITSMLRGPVYTSDYFATFAARDPPAAALLRKLNELHRRPILLRRGDHLDIASGAAIDVLWPTDGLPYSVNDTGMVLRLTYAGRSVLFPADIQTNGMLGLLHAGGSLHADVLVAAHHGSSEPITPRFVDAVNPSFIVASNAQELTGKQRTFDRMMTGRQLLRTSDHGAITIHMHGDGTVTLDTFRVSQTAAPVSTAAK